MTDIDPTETPLKLIELIKITLADGTVYYFNEWEKSFAFGGQTYTRIPMRSQPVPRMTSLQALNKDVILPRHSDYITPADLRTGSLKNAIIQVYWVNRTDTTKWRSVFKGKAADVTFNFTTVQIKFKSDLNIYNRMVPKYDYEASCQYRIYNQWCGLVKADHSVTGTFDAGCTATVLQDSARTEADNYFQFGYLEVTSGDEDDETRMVVASQSGQFTILKQLTGVPSAGETYALYPQCRREYATCKARFSNEANFFGFPDIPVREDGG